MRHRQVTFDNIATPGAPVWRARYATPLTPRAVRREIVRQAMELPDHERASWIDARRTPLDRALSDEEANALEDYVMCEAILAGSARCADYCGDRVQTARAEMQHISDSWRSNLLAHESLSKRLNQHDAQILSTFTQQMGNDFAPSDAEAAILFQLPGSDRRAAWVACVAAVARKLV